MALSLSSSLFAATHCQNHQHRHRWSEFKNSLSSGSVRQRASISCESNETTPAPEESGGGGGGSWKLKIGSPVIFTEAPKVLKTAASMPCLRANSGLVKPGDVGRIMSRKPKDVWAVRLAIGTYLIDGKYFKPLELDDQ